MQVIGYILQGSLDKARPMLAKKANLQPAARGMYKLMDNLLSKMPYYNVRVELDVHLLALLPLLHIYKNEQMFFLAFTQVFYYAHPAQLFSSI